MGKTSILTLLALLVGAPWIQLSVADSQEAEASEHAGRQFEGLARDAAHTGFARAAHEAETDTLGALLPSQGATADGTYRVSFTEVGTRPREVVVRSEGRAGAARHIVEALYRDSTPDSTAAAEDLLAHVPPYLRYAVFGGSQVRLSVLPRVQSGADSLNADVHTNGQMALTLSLSALLGAEAVQGFGTYAGALTAPALLANPARAFRPRSNPDAQTTLRRDDTVPTQPIQVMDVADAHRALGREVVTTGGQLRLLGNVALGTRDAPKVLVVRGDLALVDAVFEGYGVILVEGTVVVDATVTGLLAALQGRPEGEVLIASQGPIVFNGLGDVQGHYFTNQSALFTGAATLHGSVIALGQVDFLLAPTVRFVPPAPSLTIGLPGNPRSTLEQVSKREWKVVPDA